MTGNEAPQFGALPVSGGVRFRVPAPSEQELHLVLHDGRAAGPYLMPDPRDGVRELVVRGAAAGDRYRYRFADGALRPDPASRFQPEGVHGPSQIVDPWSFRWTDEGWPGPSVRTLAAYELHVGTFTRCGTFHGVRERLDDLRDLGVTTIELMPVADFAGARNWGYDGVALYAPSRAYGTPDDLRALVNEAHRLGLAVILDLVYNHLGPEGAYLPRFNPDHLTTRHSTPWGTAVNLEEPAGALARRFLIDNAGHWIREYHFDGFRLDATHALIDSSRTHFVRELCHVARRSAEHPIVLHAEDHRNLADIIASGYERAWELDGVWADDFHHICRRLVSGDAHGYYVDYEGTTAELARTIRQGWLYAGQTSRHFAASRGTDPSGLPMYKFVTCLQNHDQIGNRALGERLHHQVDAATWRALSVVLLTAPTTPLLFMGQEWAASTPFQFFTDLEPGLGAAVTQGRRQEFREFPEFADPDALDRIPDPQAESTFDASRLRWEERTAPPHALVLELYRALLRLRASVPALANSVALSGEAHAPGPDLLVIRRGSEAEGWWVVACLRGAGVVDLSAMACYTGARIEWDAVLSTEDSSFAADPRPLRLTLDGGRPAVSFERPGALVLRAQIR